MRIPVSIVQMQSGTDIEENFRKSGEFIGKVSASSKLVVFPEYQVYCPDFSGSIPMVKDSDIISRFGPYSRDRHLMVNYPENAGMEKPYNCSATLSGGRIVAKYRKIHLYDAMKKRESDFYMPGDSLSGKTDLEGITVGTQICYDLRFPEACRNLRISGARIVVYQAGWFSGPGKINQWRSMLVSRAIENGCFILASAQCGPSFTGHSMVVDPYGNILSELEDGEGILESVIDSGLIEKYDTDYPLMEQRNPSSDLIDH